MANCAKCGAPLNAGARQCGACGTPLIVAGGAPDAPGAGSASQSNVLALVAYLTGGIAGIFFIVAEQYKSDKFLRFHSFQSIFFCIANIAFWILFSIIGGIIAAATLGIGGLILAPVALLVGLGLTGYWIFLMYKAYKNERYMIPFIGGLAAKQAG